MAAVARGNPARWWKSRSCGSASRAPGSLFISPFRRLTSSGTLAFLLLLIASFWYITNPTRLSRLSEVLLSRVLGGQVIVHSAHISYSGTLILNGVEVRTDDADPTRPSANIPIVTADRIEARFDWTSLFAGQLNATQLVAFKPIFRPIEDRESGHWNYEHLRPPTPATQPATTPRRKLTLPVVVVQDARVQWFEYHGGVAEETAETIIDGQLMPDSVLPSTYRWQFAQRSSESPAVGSDAEAVTQLAYIGAVITGSWNVANNDFTAVCRDVVMSDALKRGMPRQVRNWCDQYQLAGKIAQLSLTFNKEEGLLLAVDFEKVSMIPMIEPEQGVGVTEKRPAYPLPVRDVSGSVIFTPAKPEITISNLQGEVLGYQFRISGVVHGYSSEAPLEMKLEFPQAVVGDTYPPIFMASITSQDALQRIAPHGKCDITVNMVRTQPRGPIVNSGSIVCYDAKMRFAHLPFPLDHINGLVTFDKQGVFFHDVVGRADENTVKISGLASTNWTSPAVDMTVSSDNVTFDDRLGACLPAKYIPVWNMFSLKAHGGFVCRVTRSNSFFDSPKVVVDVDIDSAEGYMRAVPYTFTQAKGRLHFEADETRIDSITAITGKDGSGRVSISGVVHHPNGDVSRLQPDLHLIANVPLDGALLMAFPEEFTDKLDSVQLAGRIKFDGTVERNNSVRPAAASAVGAQVVFNGLLSWFEGSLKVKDSFQLSGINTKVLVAATDIDIREFTALLPDAENIKLSLNGKFDVANYSGRLALHADGIDVPLKAEPPAVLPAQYVQLWKDYSPSGKLDLTADAALRIDAPAVTSAVQSSAPPPPYTLETFSAKLTPHDLTVAKATWPEPITHINGVIDIVPGKVTMNGMTAGVGHVGLTWNGTYDPVTGGCDLVGGADAAGFPQKWLGILPQSLVNFIDTKKESTTLKLTLTRLNRPATDKPWDYVGSLETTGLSTTGTLALNSEKATIVANGSYDPAADRFGLSAVLAATNILMNERTIDTLTAKIAVSPEQKTIDFTELDGKVAGGVLQGVIHVRTAPAEAVTMPGVPGSMPALAATVPATQPFAGSYDAELLVKDAQLSRLLLPATATEEERKKVSTGLVTATLDVQETFGPMGDRTGRGELVVREGNMYNVPLSMGLMQIATLRLPIASAFQEASISYYLRGDEISFEKILLESPGINLAGAGSMTFSTKTLNLNFLTESPNEIAIPVISQIIRQTRNELLELTVTGPIDKPEIKPIPLSTLSNALRALLPKRVGPGVGGGLASPTSPQAKVR